MRTYELMCIVQPEVDEEGMNALNARIAEIITGTGGEVISTEVLGRRRLAFPIRRKTDGTYVLTYANLDNPGLAELQRRLRLTEEVIRYLIVRPDEDEVPLPGEAEAALEPADTAQDLAEDEGIDAAFEDDETADETGDETADETGDEE